MRRTPIFNNASSIVKKEVMNRVMFDDSATNLEDFLWAKEVLSLGYWIRYTDKAEVYHHHGIHQHPKETPSSRVVGGINTLRANNIFEVDNPDWLDARNHKFLVITRDGTSPSVGSDTVKVSLDDFRDDADISTIYERFGLDRFEIDYLVIAESLAEPEVEAIRSFVADNTEDCHLVGDWRLSAIQSIVRQSNLFVTTPIV